MAHSELRDLKVAFVSLVPKGANRRPWREKDEDGEDGDVGGNGLRAIEVFKTDRASATLGAVDASVIASTRDDVHDATASGLGAWFKSQLTRLPWFKASTSAAPTTETRPMKDILKSLVALVKSEMAEAGKLEKAEDQEKAKGAIRSKLTTMHTALGSLIESLGGEGNADAGDGGKKDDKAKAEAEAAAKAIADAAAAAAAAGADSEAVKAAKAATEKAETELAAARKTIEGKDALLKTAGLTANEPGTTTTEKTAEEVAAEKAEAAKGTDPWAGVEGLGGGAAAVAKGGNEQTALDW